MTEPTNGSGSPGPVKRRTVLKTTGSVALAGGAMTGVASAHVIDEAVFCGCSQVCACGSGAVEVIVARETDEGFTCERIPIQEEDGEPFSFCYEVEDGKVIAIEEGDGVTVCNPHEPCAGDALDHCGDETSFNCHTNKNRYGESGGPCGDAFLRDCGENGDGNERSRRGRGNGGGNGKGNAGRDGRANGNGNGGGNGRGR